VANGSTAPPGRRHREVLEELGGGDLHVILYVVKAGCGRGAG